MSVFVGICRSSVLCFAALLTTIGSLFTSINEHTMAANFSSSTEALLHENARLVAQSKEVSEKLRQLMANPVRQKLRELGVEDEGAFYAWLEKQISGTDMAQAERLAQEQLAQLLAPPALEHPASAGRARRVRQMV